MTILVRELRALAQATPHKEWRAGNYYGKPFLADIEVLADTPDGLMVVMQGNQNFTAESVAAVAFVGAASPAAVLALLDEIERLMRAAKYCEDIDATHDNHRETMLYDLAIERDQLKAENTELKDGLHRIIRETRLGDVAFGIACEVMGELSVQHDPEEQRS